MIMKVIAWCLANVRTVLIIMGAIITGFVYPFAKESIAFVHMGFENRENIKANTVRVRNLEITQAKYDERSNLIFGMLKEIRDRDYEELKEARKKR
jgi:hypothetical protein